MPEDPKYGQGTKIVVLEIVYQWKATKAQIAADKKRTKEERQLVGREIPRVSAKEYVDCDIPVGPGTDGREALTRLIVRAASYHMEPHYETFYCIAHFLNPDDTRFDRTVMPRTEISERFRRLR